MGNSEVGHLNIGAGRVIYQDIVRINLAVKNNQLVRKSVEIWAFNFEGTTILGYNRVQHF